MKTYFTKPLVASSIHAFVLGMAMLCLPMAHAAFTIWNGPTTNFVQDAIVFGQPPEADVIIPGTVSLTRNGNHWLYNTNVESVAAVGTPSDTEWAFGALNNATNLTYQSFDSFRDSDLSTVLLTGGPMVCHLINQDIYLSVQFTAWPHGGGPFAYTRSTPNVVAPPPTPTVNITTPTNSAVFAAPANVSLTANASVSAGSVTNVSFFGNSNLLGLKKTAPFTITASNLAAGSYSLTAVATAAGISATSAPVSISVVTPVTTSLAAPAVMTANNQFAFSYSTTPGLRYEVDISSNLFNWTPIATNVATGNPSFFTNPISGAGKYYRVGRLPNP